MTTMTTMNATTTSDERTRSTASPLAIRSVFVSGALALVVACGGAQHHTQTGEQTPAIEPAKPAPALLNKETPVVTKDTIDAALTGRLAFAAAFYQKVRAKSGNLFVSPLSVSEALEMTWLGARGETADAMATALHVGVSQDEAIATQRAIGDALEPKRFRGQGKNYTLERANRVWVDTGTKLDAGYADDIREAFGAGPEGVNFRTESESARDTINAWVAERTREKITSLLPSGSVTQDTRLVLTNAVYFKAGWLNAFSKGATQDAPFYIGGGTAAKVPTMNLTARLPFHENDELTVVSLAYEGAAAEMLLLMPNRGELEALEASLTAARITELVALPQSSSKVKLSMPSFEFRSKLSAASALKELGMTKAFSASADFSGMTTGDDLAISDVFHEAFVAVDEEGTEAAAATAVVMRTTGMMNPRPPRPIAIDRPFVFLIRDRGTGSVLFMGRVVDPR